MSFKSGEPVRVEVMKLMYLTSCFILHTSKEPQSFTYATSLCHCLFTFRDGQSLTDDEVIGMLIGLLLAGQHTSSTTSAWMGFFLARDKPLQVHTLYYIVPPSMQEHVLHHCVRSCKYFLSEQNFAYEEQLKVCGKELPHLNYDQVCAHQLHFQSCLSYKNV